MTITNDSITSIIERLEQSNDASVAYFSFTTDESGEHGAIRANKEGLRSYALELLKKSLELEEKRDGRSLCFSPYEWLISEADYDLIRSVMPEYRSRTEIVATQFRQHSNEAGLPAKRKRFFGLFTLATSFCTLAAALAAFS